jgi:hypothetical protein
MRIFLRPPKADKYYKCGREMEGGIKDLLTKLDYSGEELKGNYPGVYSKTI